MAGDLPSLRASSNPTEGKIHQKKYRARAETPHSSVLTCIIMVNVSVHRNVGAICVLQQDMLRNVTEQCELTDISSRTFTEISCVTEGYHLLSLPFVFSGNPCCRHGEEETTGVCR